jgi:hypothetical protein
VIDVPEPKTTFNKNWPDEENYRQMLMGNTTY